MDLSGLIPMFIAAGYTQQEVDSLVGNPQFLGLLVSIRPPQFSSPRVTTTQFRAWGEGGVGGWADMPSLLTALSVGRKVVITPEALRVLEQVPLQHTGQKKVGVARVSGAELGFFTERSVYEALLSAVGRGLDLCPPEEVPSIMLVCLDALVPGERVHVGMRPLGEHNEVLYLERDSGATTIGTVPCGPDHFWTPETKWAFIMPASTGNP